MRIVLALLMSFVLLQSESFAISGGPVFRGSLNVVGTYAGVLVETSTTDTSAAAPAIGLFTLGIPASALATGTLLFFDQGRIYTGSISAVADPTNGKITGLLEATFTF